MVKLTKSFGLLILAAALFISVTGFGARAEAQAVSQDTLANWEELGARLRALFGIPAVQTQTGVGTAYTAASPQVGARVRVESGPLHVRAVAGTSGTLLGSQPVGARGTVTLGPSPLTNGYVWWWVNFDTGPDGFVAQNFLSFSLPATQAQGQTTTATPAASQNSNASQTMRHARVAASDAAGNPISGARIEVYDHATNSFIFDTYTVNTGRTSEFNLTVGKVYRFRISKSGYQTISVFNTTQPLPAGSGAYLYGPYTLAASASTTTPPPPSGSYHVLSVSKTGSGTITSSPVGIPSAISCGGACTAGYAGDASVTLTATPASGYRFGSWSGACSDAGANPVCVLSMSNTHRNVGAAFVPSSTTPPPPTGPSYGPASVTLTANGTADSVSVPAGSSVTLAWSTSGDTANCDSLQASGNWSGTKTLSGSETVTVPGQAATNAARYTLTCTGPNGAWNAVDISTTPATGNLPNPPQNMGGNGGYAFSFPAGGESFPRGSAQTVSWNSGGFWHATVGVLSPNTYSWACSSCSNVGVSTNPENGMASIVFPASLPAGTYQLAVQFVGGPSLPVVSQYFTVGQ